MEHGLQCFAELVRLLLGVDAIAEEKTECDAGLCVLGVDTELSRSGLTFRPSADKRQKWVALIDAALSEDKLCPGIASKLAGKLNWGGAYLFHRIGRAMLRPIYDQQARRDGSMRS
mgnify:FL=1